MTKMAVIGKRVPRVDAREKVTGEAMYAADIKLPRMLVGKIMRSKYPHARIVKIDISAAVNLPGVKAVVTAKDLPPNLRYGHFLKDQTSLAVDKVRYIGEPIAAVAAVDEVTADKAVGLIYVEYEELPAVFDPEEAMQLDAPIIHESLASYVGTWDMIKKGNVFAHVKLKRGDVEKGFREADFVFEDKFTTQMIHPCYLEPHAAIAKVDHSGKITIWTSTQGVFSTRSLLAQILAIPFSKIRVIAPKIGGGFGGKASDVLLEPACVLLSQKAGRPVKIVMTREDEFIASNPRHPCIIEIKTGCMKDGILIARQVKLIYDSGAYTSAGPLTTCHGVYIAAGPYRIPNVKIDGYGVYTNKISCGAVRGFGTTQSFFAIESHMNIIAEKLEIDPLELRMKNGFESGDLSPTGQIMNNVGLKETLRLAAQHGNWGEKLGGKNRGRGIACSQFHTGGRASCAFVKINEDGTIGLLSGALDLGQGSDTLLCQIVAEELGVPLEDIVLPTADTDITPYDFFTLADRTTYTAGNAVRLAALDAKQQLFELAAKILEVKVDDLGLKNRMVFVKGKPKKMIPLKSLSMAAHYYKGGPIMGKGTVFPEDEPYEKQTIEGGIQVSLHAPNYIAQVAEVEVDDRTGEIKILKITAAQDVGFPINPLSLEGQMEGGIVMGIGYALTEEYSVEVGKVINPSFHEYKIPDVWTVPKIKTLFVTEKAKEGPYGAKGSGNPPIVPVAPAIANAIYNAIGVRIKDLPITADKIIKALKEKNKR